MVLRVLSVPQTLASLIGAQMRTCFGSSWRIDIVSERLNYKNETGQRQSINQTRVIDAVSEHMMLMFLQKGLITPLYLPFLLSHALRELPR